MDLSLFQRPTRLGSTLETLSRVEFESAYALTFTFPFASEADAMLTHAYSSGDIARFIDALEEETLPPIRRRSGWKLRLIAFSDTANEQMLRFHLLVSNPQEFTESQIKFAVIRSQRVLRFAEAAVSQPEWCADWYGFAANLIDLPVECLSFEFGLSQLFGVE